MRAGVRAGVSTKIDKIMTKTHFLPQARCPGEVAVQHIGIRSLCCHVLRRYGCTESGQAVRQAL